MIPAEIMERYVDNSIETLNFNFIDVPEGILIEIGGEHGFETRYTVEEVQHKKPWQKKLLARFWGMVRTALLALFSWMLRELMELVFLLVLQTA
jgi:hypothetical protein